MRNIDYYNCNILEGGRKRSEKEKRERGKIIMIVIVHLFCPISGRKTFEFERALITSIVDDDKYNYNKNGHFYL